MKTLTTAQLKTKLTSIANATDSEALQTVLAHCVFNGLVHNNIMPEHMKLIRESQAPAAFKSALGKYMPMTWSKEKDCYTFSNKKAEQTRLTLGLEFRESTIEDVADALPNVFERKVSAPKAFNLDEYTAQIAKKLEAQGIENVEEIAAIIGVMARNPSIAGDVASAAFEALDAQADARVTDNVA